MMKVDKFGDLDIYDFAGCYIIQRGDERVGGLYSNIDDARLCAIDLNRKRLGFETRWQEFNSIRSNFSKTIGKLLTQVEEDAQSVVEVEATFARVEDSMNKLLDELRKVEA